MKKDAWFNWDGSTNFVSHWRANARVVDDFGDLIDVHRCAECRRWLLAIPENFQPLKRRPTGHVESWFAWCRPCARRLRREKRAAQSEEKRREEWRKVYERIRADPERSARRRERNRKNMQRWRRTENYRAARRRWREKVKSTPALRERVNEQQRMAYRLKKEREGQPLVPVKRTMSSGRGPEIIAAPLQRAAVEFARRMPEWMTELEKATQLGISDKLLREWGDGRARKHVRADVAERVLDGMDLLWWDIYEPPPNGHKSGRPEDVLRYIDDAEDYIRVSVVFAGELVE